MPREVRIHVLSQNGSRDLDPELYDEYEPMKLAWQAPGMVYRWVDRDDRVFPTRKRQGWIPCRRKESFLDRGCPEDLVPGVETPGGELHFGDTILCEMSIELASKRYRAMITKTAKRRAAGTDAVRRAGEQAARELRSRGADVGDNIVEDVTAEEVERDWTDRRRVVARTGQHDFRDPAKV